MRNLLVPPVHTFFVCRYYSANQTKNDVIFDMSKRCSHTPKNGYKKLYRKLRATYSMGVNKDEIAADVICNAKCLVFGNPRQVRAPGCYHLCPLLYVYAP